MKKIYKPLIFLVLSAFTISCEEFLNRENYNTLNESLFYKTADDAEKAITGAYEPFRSDGQYRKRLYWLNSIAADISWPGGVNDNREYDEFFDYNIKSDNGAIEETWDDLWPSIMRANSVLEKIPNTEMDEGMRTRILGEAHFIRGLTYFNLVRIFGKVPIILGVQNPSEMYVARDDIGEVYQLISSDLTIAVRNLPLSNPPTEAYRATKGAARAVLAQVYLTRGEQGIHESSPCWDSAVYWAGQIIQSNQYSLWQDEDTEVVNSKFIQNGYHANFRTENGKESIFEIQYTDILGTDYSYLAQEISERDACRPCSYSNWGRNTNFPKEKFVEEWKTQEPGDPRFEVTILEHGDTMWLPGGNTLTGQDFYVHDEALVTVGTNITGYIVEKWQYGNTRGRESSPQNTAVIRYAEVLLIMAEALNEMGNTAEAFQYINQVRERANLPALGGLGQEEFRDAVIRERKFELAFEFSRWFDLTRTGRLIEAVLEERGVMLTENNFILPIPLGDLTRNPNLGPQNEGY